jgi:amyloid beta A4 protein
MVTVFFFSSPSCPPLSITAGPFQSDALLVPEHCLFDHIHNQTQCMDFDDWNKTASDACAERTMRVKSFAMLLPCGIDVFSGVEFVCCPRKKAANKTKAKKGSGYKWKACL